MDTKGNDNNQIKVYAHENDEMRHRVLSDIETGTEMHNNRIMSNVNWNKGLQEMHKQKGFVGKIYEGVDLVMLKAREKRRKERKLLAEKYKGNIELSLQVQMEQLKKETKEDLESGFDMGVKVYSSFDIMSVNKKHIQNYKNQYKYEDTPKQIVKVDTVNVELQILEGTTDKVETKHDNNFGLGDKPWHLYSPTEIMAELATCPEGLTSEEHAKRLEEYGLNQITPVPQMHWFVKFLLHMIGGFQIFLWAGGLLCMIAFGINIEAKDYQTLALGILCFVVVIGTAIFSSYQEGKSDDVMAALKALTPSEVWAVRDGKEQIFLAETLVPGDIVHVKSGEKVPADLRVLSSFDLKVNNASLTGENVDIKLGVEANSETLYEAKNIARMGCNFTNGTGVCIVFGTGDHTFFGSIAKSTTTIERPESCLTAELKRLVYSKIYL